MLAEGRRETVDRLTRTRLSCGLCWIREGCYVQEEQGMVRKAILLFVLLGLLVASLGCNTFRGLGRDISNAGDAITEAAGGTP